VSPTALKTFADLQNFLPQGRQLVIGEPRFQITNILKLNGLGVFIHVY